MQAALAKGLGVSKDKIKIDYKAKTASVAMGEARPDMVALAKSMKDGQYKATLAK